MLLVYFGWIPPADEVLTQEWAPSQRLTSGMQAMCAHVVQSMAGLMAIQQTHGQQMYPSLSAHMLKHPARLSRPDGTGMQLHSACSGRLRLKTSSSCPHCQAHDAMLPSFSCTLDAQRAWEGLY